MARRRGFRLPNDLHFCRVQGCGSVIEHWKVLCDAHFRALPWETKTKIREAREAKLPGLAKALMIEGCAGLADAARDRAVATAARTAAMMGERE